MLIGVPQEIKDTESRVGRIVVQYSTKGRAGRPRKTIGRTSP